MASVVFYFQVHQPYRLRHYSVFDSDRHYFDDLKNAEWLRKVARRCYVPANKALLETIRAHQGRFRVAFSVTGVALEQFRLFAPDVVAGFQELAKTGCVDFLDETYYHSMAFLYPARNSASRSKSIAALMKELFGQRPRVFRNTEFIYNNDLAHFVSHMGYDAILTEGADHILGRAARISSIVRRTPTSRYC